jgi:hypothetical protein
VLQFDEATISPAILLPTRLSDCILAISISRGHPLTPNPQADEQPQFRTQIRRSALIFSSAVNATGMGLRYGSTAGDVASVTMRLVGLVHGTSKG